MPTIKSDLGNTNYPTRGFREIEVPDESEMYNPPPPMDYSNDLDIEAINARLASRGLPPLNSSELPTQENKKNKQMESLQELEAKVQAAKRARTGKERLSEAAKRRIEMLCGLSKNTKSVDLDGNIYVLRTLKGKEMQESLMAASYFDGTVNLPFETRKQLLAHSLMQIAGTDVNLFLGDNSLEARLAFLEELDDVLLGKLYETYLSLVNEVRDKYEIKSDADAQGVLSDLKK